MLLYSWIPDRDIPESKIDIRNTLFQTILMVFANILLYEEQDKTNNKKNQSLTIC